MTLKRKKVANELQIDKFTNYFRFMENFHSIKHLRAFLFNKINLTKGPFTNESMYNEVGGSNSLRRSAFLCLVHGELIIICWYILICGSGRFAS